MNVTRWKNPSVHDGWRELQQQNIGLRLTKFAVKMRALRLLHDAGVIESRTRYSHATPIEYRAKEIR